MADMITRNTAVKRDELVAAIDKAIYERRSIKIEFGPTRPIINVGLGIASATIDDYNETNCTHPPELRVTHGERTLLICDACYSIGNYNAERRVRPL
jgi:hypothetical protein